MKTPHHESVLSRAARILEAFSQDEPALTVSEIARRSGLHVATASRLVAELVAHGCRPAATGTRCPRRGLAPAVRGSAGEQRLGQHGQPPAYHRVHGYVGHPGQGADA
jgi:hypothetical protein